MIHRQKHPAAVIAVALMLCGATYAQNHITPKGLQNRDYPGRIRVVDANPAGNACTLSSPPTSLAYHSGTSWDILTCQSSVWTAVPAVVGPASAVDNAIARYSGITGKAIQAYTSGGPTISDTGEMRLAGGPWFDVQHPDYGAVCDGATDAQAGINAAIVAANAAGGGTVLIPNADCELTVSAVTLLSNVNIRGTGPSSKISTTLQTIQLLAGSGVSDITISDLKFEGGGRNAGEVNLDTAISLLAGSSRVKIDRCEFRKCNNCMWADTATELTITNSAAYQFAWSFNFWSQVQDGSITGNFMDGRRAGIGDGLSAGYGPTVEDNSLVNPSKRIIISDNRVTWTRINGILVSANRSVINGNILHNNEQSAGINVVTLAAEVSDPTGTGNDNIVSDNTMHNAGGIAIGGNISGFGGQNYVVANNVITDSLFSGITMNNGSRYCNVSGNTIKGPKSHGIITGATGVKGCLIDNNYVFEAGKAGAGSVRGIICQSTDGVIVEGNYVEGSGTHGIYQNGTANDWTVIDNTVIDSGRVTSTVGQVGIWDAANPGTRSFISGNRTWSDDGVHQAFGIQVSTTSTDAVVINNNNKGNLATAGMSLGAGSVVASYGNVDNAVTEGLVIGLGADADITLTFDQGTGADPTIKWDDAGGEFDVSANLTVAGTSVCLQDGTNCPLTVGAAGPAATCTVGEMFFQTDATGANGCTPEGARVNCMCVCSATNTWTVVDVE